MAVEGVFDLKTSDMNTSSLSHRFSMCFNMDEPPSPEMFESNTEDDYPQFPAPEPEPSPVKLSREEVIERSDQMQYQKINKYLSGVPPPPKHTSCPLNCSEMLALISENKHYFWMNMDDKDETATSQVVEVNENSNDSAFPDNESVNENSTTESASQEQSNPDITRQNSSATSDTFTLSSVSSSSDMNKSKELSANDLDDRILLLYCSIPPEEVKNLTFKEAYDHKTFGIHYNRNKSTEDFERLTVRLCERYIHVDTQSTCNIWFTSSATSSSNDLLGSNGRLKGQSPGKRLNYLTKRRRTFSRANLQNLTAIDKKYRMLSYKKPVMKKGKSPRGKSPRGKSPRGKSPRGRTPKSSAKKRAIRKLAMDSQSPLKPKMEFPKRALFQSPPSEKACPSHASSVVNSQSIKRALFSSNEDDTQSRPGKRKNDEPMDNPRLKWSRSLSYDCPKAMERNSPIKKLDRHATDSNLGKPSSTASGKIEMSAAHRKKLFWAVAEALRAKGIGMGDSRFKQYAACLARMVKKYMPDLENRDIPRKPGSTTDRMLKLAKHHVYLVIEGKVT